MADSKREQAEKKRDRSPEKGNRVCPNCTESNPSDADFCRNCGTPLGDTTTLARERGVRTGVWGHRRASSQPPRLITVVEWWLGLGPCLIVFPYFLAQQLADSTEIGVYEVMELLVGFLFLVLSGAVLYRITVNYWSRPKQP